MTAARTLVTTASPLRLQAAELASATVRAARWGSPSPRRIASSLWQFGASSASCRRSAAFTLVGKTISPRAAWAAMYPNASTLSIKKLYPAGRGAAPRGCGCVARARAPEPGLLDLQSALDLAHAFHALG